MQKRRENNFFKLTEPSKNMSADNVYLRVSGVAGHYLVRLDKPPKKTRGMERVGNKAEAACAKTRRTAVVEA